MQMGKIDRSGRVLTVFSVPKTLAMDDNRLRNDFP